MPSLCACPPPACSESDLELLAEFAGIRRTLWPSSSLSTGASNEPAAAAQQLEPEGASSGAPPGGPSPAKRARCEAGGAAALLPAVQQELAGMAEQLRQRGDIGPAKAQAAMAVMAAVGACLVMGHHQQQQLMLHQMLPAILEPAPLLATLNTAAAAAAAAAVAVQQFMEEEEEDEE